MKSRERAQTASRSLIPGSRTLVYYEKNNPASSMLVLPSELSPLSQVGEIVIALVGSIGMTLYGRIRNGS